MSNDVKVTQADREAAIEADAHLRAAAPELLEALENLTANLDHAFPALANLGPLKSARAAIAKARGQS